MPGVHHNPNPCWTITVAMHSEGLVRQIYVALGALYSEPNWTDAEVSVAIKETAKLLPEANEPDALEKAVTSQISRSFDTPKVEVAGFGGIRSAAALIGLDLNGLEPAMAGVRAAISTAVRVRKDEAARSALNRSLSDAWKAPVKVGGHPIFDPATEAAIYKMAGDPGLQARMGFAPGVFLQEALDSIVPKPNDLSALEPEPSKDVKNLMLVKLPVGSLITGDVALLLAQLQYTIKRMDRDALSMALHGHPEHSRGIASVIHKSFKVCAAMNGDMLELGFTVDPQRLTSYTGKEADVERYVIAAFERLRTEMSKGTPASNIKV